MHRVLGWQGASLIARAAATSEGRAGASQGHRQAALVRAPAMPPLGPAGREPRNADLGGGHRWPPGPLSPLLSHGPSVTGATPLSEGPLRPGLQLGQPLLAGLCVLGPRPPGRRRGRQVDLRIAGGAGPWKRPQVSRPPGPRKPLLPQGPRWDWARGWGSHPRPPPAGPERGGGPGQEPSSAGGSTGRLRAQRRVKAPLPWAVGGPTSHARARLGELQAQVVQLLRRGGGAGGDVHVGGRRASCRDRAVSPGAESSHQPLTAPTSLLQGHVPP